MDNNIATSFFGTILSIVMASLIVYKRRNDAIVERAIESGDAAKQDAEELYLALMHERTVDQQTHLPNRLSLILDSASKHIALFDIRHFSSISQSYGSKIADEILIDFFVRIVNNICTQGVKVFRYDVDIAAITAESSTVSNQAFEEICREIHNYVGFYFYENHYKKKEKIPISISMGISFNADGKQLHGAEFALGLAKKNGTNIHIFDDTSVAIHKRNYRDYAKQIITLWEAMETDRVCSHYQPIVCVNTKKPVKYEALVRIKSEDKFVFPGGFLPGVEFLRLGPIVTRIMFKKTWGAARLIPVSFNINISDIESTDIREMILSTIRSDSFRASRFTFEIVEGEDASRSTNIDSFIQEVKKCGSLIAIDDFGTGYSNFDRLASQWQVDIIKIDGSLIKNIENDNMAKSTLRGIVRIAKDAGIQTVAEYVENEAIFRIIKECGIDYAQGHYFGKAVPLDEIIAEQNCGISGESSLLAIDAS